MIKFLPRSKLSDGLVGLETLIDVFLLKAVGAAHRACPFLRAILPERQPTPGLLALHRQSKSWFIVAAWSPLAIHLHLNPFA